MNIYTLTYILYIYKDGIVGMFEFLLFFLSYRESDKKYMCDPLNKHGLEMTKFFIVMI